MKASWRSVLSEYVVFWLALVYVACVWPLVPEIGSSENISNVFLNTLPLLIVGIGQTFVLITGGIDLSVTAGISLCSVAGAWVMTSDNGLLAGNWAAVPVGIVVMLAAGALLGALNGFAIGYLKMPAFMVTLASMMFVGGLAVWLTQSDNIYNLPSGFVALGQGRLALVPYAFVVAIVVAVTGHLVLARTVFGRWLYAVGHSAAASRVAGLPVARLQMAAYVISGVCAALGSILLTARLETGSPVLGEKMLLDVIAAVVIGGTSLFGGRGKVLWTVMGAFFIILVDNTLNMIGLSYFSILAVKGTVILGAAIIDSLRTRAARAAA